MENSSSRKLIEYIKQKPQVYEASSSAFWDDENISGYMLEAHLDPDAEGVLPVCLGRATKVCDMLTEKDKTYEAVLLLGKETDTQDISGTVLRVGETEGLTQEQVKD